MYWQISEKWDISVENLKVIVKNESQIRDVKRRRGIINSIAKLKTLPITQKFSGCY